MNFSLDQMCIVVINDSLQVLNHFLSIIQLTFELIPELTNSKNNEFSSFHALLLSSTTNLIKQIDILSNYHVNMVRNKGKDRQKTRSKFERIEFSINMIQDYTDQEFYRRYRMSRDAFTELLRLIEPDLRSKRPRGGRTVHPPILKLAMTLRWLAGGDILDLVDLYATTERGIYYIMNKVITAINNRLEISWPNENEQFECSQEFYFKTQIPGCIGAIDGLQIRVEKAGRKFMNRKGYASVNLQAICDSKCRFIFSSLKVAGSVHDSQAVRMTQMWNDIEKRRGLGRYFKEGRFMFGDAAYPLRSWLITPFSRCSNPAHDNFNLHFSRGRQVIERAFGMMVRKWKKLKTALCCSDSANMNIVKACLRLHNFCIDHNQVQEVHTEEEPPDYHPENEEFRVMDLLWRAETRMGTMAAYNNGIESVLFRLGKQKRQFLFKLLPN